MKVRVTLTETKTVKRTYEVDGVNSLDNARKCAERCYNRQFQPNAYMTREVPYPPQITDVVYEVVDE